MRTHHQLRAAARELSPFAATALAGWGAVLIGTRIDWVQYGV